MNRFVFLAFMLPFAAQAQGMDERMQDFAMLYASVDPAECLNSADAPDAAQACIGTVSGMCMEQEQDGYSTFGMMTCMMAETQAWDDLLNAEYALLRARAQAMDANESQPDYAVRADLLLDAQRAWITFRDAECALSYSEFGGGSMRVLNGSGCMMQMTAERTIELKFMFGTY